VLASVECRGVCYPEESRYRADVDDAPAPLGNISSGRQYVADGVEVRFYGTEEARTLEVVGTLLTARVPEDTNGGPETTGPTTKQRSETPVCLVSYDWNVSSSTSVRSLVIKTRNLRLV
jgi:hypothetical protein